MGNRRRDVLLAGGTALMVALAFTAVNLSRAEPPLSVAAEDLPYVTLYDLPEDRLQVLIFQGDGQAFAALAQDPLLKRPEVFNEGAPEASYRAQRPLLGWLAWLTSGGQAALVPAVLVAWALVGFTVLAVAAAVVAGWRNCSPTLAVVAALTPGALITIDYIGPEALGTAVALLAVGLWGRDRPSLVIVAGLLTAAALARETLLLVPLVMGIRELLSEHRSMRRLVALGAPAVVYLMWVALVRARVGALPTDAGEGRLALPLTGLINVVGGWRPIDIACLALGVALVVATLIRRRVDLFALIPLAYAAFALVMGETVWWRFEDFSRVLLPMYVFAVVALLPKAPSPTKANMRSPVTHNL